MGYCKTHLADIQMCQGGPRGLLPSPHFATGNLPRYQDVSAYLSVFLFRCLSYECQTQNILLDDHLSVKPCDFGFALEMLERVINRTLVTAPYLARMDGYYSPELNTGRIILRVTFTALEL